MSQVVKDGINPSMPRAPLWPPGVWGATKEHLVWPPVRVHTQDMAKPSELTVSEVVGDRPLATHAGPVPDFLKGDLVLPPKA